uniref:Myb_DNA-bind_3 domain-containing protein n=1 Tax=Angiostrongylus cantonensis TaxID=6313 RepID=A0A0K0D1E0_ANGCA
MDPDLMEVFFSFNSKRARYEDDDDWADTEACDPSGGIERSAKGKGNSLLTYPYISQMEEERILSSANGSASSYAQNLAKVLFANTLDLYFKDQDPGKRQWIHRAVDFRFPSKDRSAQLMKWKNCSSAINKNMRMSERGPGEKPRQKESKPYFDFNQLFQIRERLLVDCKYVSAAYEEECYQKAQKDPVKYAEFLSLKLFEGSWDKYFKDQDVKLKDWLRQCIDRRFHLSDKSKRDARWKVCAAACNRNRTKIIGDDGNVNEYPYFPKEEEEECFRASNGVPHVYAEAMAKLLFPDTLHLFFKVCILERLCYWTSVNIDILTVNMSTYPEDRTTVLLFDQRETDESLAHVHSSRRASGAEARGSTPSVEQICRHDQDAGKRNWLHDMLDHRFPTSDKLHRVAKWKSCTVAINKNMIS